MEKIGKIKYLLIQQQWFVQKTNSQTNQFTTRTKQSEHCAIQKWIQFFFY